MTSGRASATVLRRAFVLSTALLLAACAEQPTKPAPAAPAAHPPAPARAPAHPARKPWKPLGPYTAGGLYAPGVADGTPEIPPDIANLAEPVPRAEPRSHYGNRSPYVVLGKTYTVLPSASGYLERGVASWYGTKFDGRATSSFEPYDVYQFSAAHRTLPLPSYARVTNLDNGRSVIVRINDRGPFHEGRLIDLSYAAAVKLGVNVHGTANVEVRGIDPGEPLPPAPAVAAVGADAAGTAHPVAPPKPAAPVTRPAPAAPKPVAVAPKPAAVVALPAPVPGVVATAQDPAGVPSAALHPPKESTPAPVSAGTTAAQAPVTTTTAPVAASQPSSTAASAPAALPPPPGSARTAPNVAIPDVAHALPQAVIERPLIDPSTHGFLQVASYSDRANAERMLQRLLQAGVDKVELVTVQVAGQVLWRVHVGPLRADEAERVAAHLDALGFGNPPFFKD